MNKVILVGRLTADPEFRQTQSGIASCRFSVAVNRKYKQDGETKADFIQCVAWRQTAEFVSRYFTKGKMIVVEGTLTTGRYQDKQYPQVTHFTTVVSVDSVEFAGSKDSGAGSPQTNYQIPQQQAAPQQTPHDNDSLSYGSISDFEEILRDGDVPF